MKKEIPYKFVIREDGAFLIVLEGTNISSTEFSLSNGMLIFSKDDIALDVSSNPRVSEIVNSALEIHVLALVGQESKVVRLSRA